MSERIIIGTPFAQPVVLQEFSSGDNERDFKMFPVLLGRNKVIRRFPLYMFKEDPQQEVLAAQRVFREFGSYTHLNVPNFSIIQGALGVNDVHKPYLFLVDLIKGRNLVTKSFSRREREQATEELTGFLSSFVDYAADKYTKGGLYPSDQLYYQYVYGKAPMDIENKVYFVDLDFHFGMFDIAHPELPSNEAFFNSIVGFIGGFIQLAETKLQNGTLTQVREKYIGFLNSILNDSHSYAHKAQFLKDVLKGNSDKPIRDWR